MAPKRRAGKEAATSAMEAPSPSLVIERPIAGREFSLLFRDFSSLFEAIYWLFHGESGVIHHDPVISGSRSPLILTLSNF